MADTIGRYRLSADNWPPLTVMNANNAMIDTDTTIADKIHLHLGVTNAALRWFLESSVPSLVPDDPADSAAQFIIIDRYVASSLVKTLGHKCTQPTHDGHRYELLGTVSK